MIKLTHRKQMKINKRHEGSKQTNLSIDKHQNYTDTDHIILPSITPNQQLRKIGKPQYPTTQVWISKRPETHLLNTYSNNYKRHMYINYQNPPPSKFQPGFTKILESLAKKNPRNHNGCKTRKSEPDGDVRGKGESSTPKSQGPADGSYIISTESCNI